MQLFSVNKANRLEVRCQPENQIPQNASDLLKRFEQNTPGSWLGDYKQDVLARKYLPGVNNSSHCIWKPAQLSHNQKEKWISSQKSQAPAVPHHGNLGDLPIHLLPHSSIPFPLWIGPLIAHLKNGKNSPFFISGLLHTNHKVQTHPSPLR